MLSLSKKIISILVLASVLTIVFSSFILMMHGSDKSIPGDCPFSVMGASICPQDIVAVVIHHISTYYTFFNVPIGAGITALIISLLFVIGVVFVILVYPPSFGLPALAPILYDFPFANSYQKKITRWLSLFENSPSHS